MAIDFGALFDILRPSMYNLPRRSKYVIFIYSIKLKEVICENRQEPYWR